MNILDIIKQHGETITSVASKIGVTRSSLSQSLAKPSYTTLERIATALHMEPWELLAPPSVVEEARQARQQKEETTAQQLVGLVKVGDKTYTADNLQQLIDIVHIISGGKNI